MGGGIQKESMERALCAYVRASGHLPASCVCSSGINGKFGTQRHLCKHQRTTVKAVDACLNTLAGGNGGTFISESIRYFPQELAKTKNRGKIGAASNGMIVFSFKCVS